LKDKRRKKVRTDNEVLDGALVIKCEKSNDGLFIRLFYKISSF